MTTHLLMLATLQVAIGLAVAIGALLSIIMDVDRSSPEMARVVLVLLLVAGVWYGCEPLAAGVPTTTKPGLLFAFVVAWRLWNRRGLIEWAQEVSR